MSYVDYVHVSAQSCLTLRDPMDCSPARLLCPWNSPSENTEEGSHFLPEDIFPIQGLNPCLKLHWQVYTDYHLKILAIFPLSHWP